MRHLALQLAWVASLLLAPACGGGDGPASPPATPTTPSTPAPPLPTGWSVAGQLVDTVQRQPVPGAQIAPTWGVPPVTTDANGGYELSATANPPTTPYRLAITGTDLVSREVWVTWQRGPRTGVTLDVIRNRPPFSMDFYRQFVRGTYDYDVVYSVLRWMDSPRFFLKTVDQNGRPIEPEVLAVIREAIPRAVTTFSAGKLSTAALEMGTEVRQEAIGWVNVNIVRAPGEDTPCGRATLGANPATITLFNDVCSCGSNKIPGDLVLHEVGHVLGFFHVPDPNAVMYPISSGRCPRGELSPAEKYHVAIAYSRPRGNMDPDNDPSSDPHQAAPASVVVIDR